MVRGRRKINKIKHITPDDKEYNIKNELIKLGVDEIEFYDMGQIDIKIKDIKLVDKEKLKIINKILKKNKLKIKDCKILFNDFEDFENQVENAKQINENINNINFELNLENFKSKIKFQRFITYEKEEKLPRYKYLMHSNQNAKNLSLDDIIKINELYKKLNKNEKLEIIDNYSLKNKKDYISFRKIIRLDNITQLNKQQALKLKQKSDAEILIYDNDYEPDEYSLDTYISILDKLSEMFGNIDITLPQKQKFAEIYKRVCENLEYDFKAGYPHTDAEFEYARKSKETARNLENGLLYGKCVCKGYAEILRNALALFGIQSQKVSGKIYKTEKELLAENFEFKNGVYSKKGRLEYKKLMGKDGIFYCDFHAWNKVKLDGKWYNVDPTLDRENIINGKMPNHVLNSDSHIIRYQHKIDFAGPKCLDNASKEEIAEIFSGNKNRKMVKNEKDIER